MSTVEKSIRLYAWKTNYHTFRIVQGEMDSRRFNIQLFSTTIPVTLHDCHVCFYAVKPDGKKAYLECEILDADTGLVSVELSAQVCAVDGTVDCWIQVVSDAGTDLRFEGMNIEVSECDLNESAESSNDFGFLTTAIAEMRPATARANEAAARANEAADNADRATAESEAQTAKAKTATSNANTAKNNADKATTNANNAAASAIDAANTANLSASVADEKAGLAHEAASAANIAKTNADKATTAANNAATAANNAARAANDAKASIDGALEDAEQAVEDAETAVANAEKAVTDATSAIVGANSAAKDARSSSARANEAAVEAEAAAQAARDSVSEITQASEEFIRDELAKRGQVKPEFAQSFEWLEQYGDSSKLYVLPDGFIYAYYETVTSGPAYTNVLDTAPVALNKRWSHSKKDVSDAAGHVVFGKFRVKVGDVIRVNLPNTTQYFSADYNRYHYFDASGNYVDGHVDGAPTYIGKVTSEGDEVSSWVVGYENATPGNVSTNAKIAGADKITQMNWILRLKDTAITQADLAGLVLTINEKIENKTVVGYQWKSTGHSIVPSDNENRIVAAEQKIQEHTEQLEELENAVNRGGMDENEKAALTRIANWKYPIHEDAPVFLLDENKPAVGANERTAAAIYAKYDALAAANPEFISRELCGNASDGSTPIYVYHFKEAQPHNESKNWSETKPVILICSGVHPTEQAGVHSMYYALAEVTTNPKLRDLRRNVHFIVMPMINPTALSDSTYGVRNPDGIQVHYNFEVDFKYPNDPGYVTHGNRNHGGETPLSIPETQYFDALMKQYKDNLVCVMSCHNNDVDVNRGAGYIWCSCATHFMCNLAFRLVDKMSHAWRDKYGADVFDAGVRWANDYALQKAAEGSSLFNPNYVYEQPDWDHRVGMASISGSGGTEYKQALKYGVHGINVEACSRCMILDRDFSKTFTSNVITLGTETYINFFRTFMAVYPSLDKKDYAPSLPWVY